MINSQDEWRVFRERHTCRDFGSTGRRVVRIAVLTAGREAIVYTIDHLWRRDQGECRSILFVRQPSGLTGTFVRMHEYGLSDAADVELKLTTASRSIDIDCVRQLQQVLGTDFCYEDLRFWRPLPLDCLSANASEDGAMTFDIEAKGTNNPVRARLVGRDDGEVLSYRLETPMGPRVWWVDEWAAINPPSPKSIRLSRLNGRFESWMDLLALDRSTQWDDEFFEPETEPGRVLRLFAEIGAATARAD